MTSVRRFVCILTLFLASSGCDRSDAPSEQDARLGPGDVATVNGERIPESVFRVYVMNSQRNPDELTPEQRQGVIEELIQLKLLAEQAEERGLLTERRTAAEQELQRMQFAARAMALRHIEENRATEAEIQALYDENLPRLAATQYKARHILVDSRDAAAAAIEQLRGGKDFIALAQEHSDGPTGPNGGDLGWFTAESMAQPIVDAVQAMQVGAYSTEPVETQFGFHVVLLEDTRVQEPPSLESLRTELQNAVERGKLETFVTSLRDAALVGSP